MTFLEISFAFPFVQPNKLCSKSYERLHFGMKTRPLSLDITSQRYLFRLINLFEMDQNQKLV